VAHRVCVLLHHLHPSAGLSISCWAAFVTRSRRSPTVLRSVCSVCVARRGTSVVAMAVCWARSSFCSPPARDAALRSTHACSSSSPSLRSVVMHIDQHAPIRARHHGKAMKHESTRRFIATLACDVHAELMVISSRQTAGSPSIICTRQDPSRGEDDMCEGPCQVCRLREWSPGHRGPSRSSHGQSSGEAVRTSRPALRRAAESAIGTWAALQLTPCLAGV